HFAMFLFGWRYVCPQEFTAKLVIWGTGSHAVGLNELTPLTTRALDECRTRSKEETMMAGRVSWTRGWQHPLVGAVVFTLLSVASSALAQNTFPTNGNVGIGTTSPGEKLT